MERRSWCAACSSAIGGTFLSFEYAGEVRALIAPLPAGERVAVSGLAGGRRGGTRREGGAHGRTFEVVDALSVQDADADVHPCPATT